MWIIIPGLMCFHYIGVHAVVGQGFLRRGRGIQKVPMKRSCDASKVVPIRGLTYIGLFLEL